MTSAEVTIFGGLTLTLDPNDSLGISKNEYEPEIAEVMRRYVKPGMTVLDVGANIGYFTLLLSGLVGEKGTVHAVEAAPHNIELLRRNVTQNRLKNVEIYHAAAGQSDGTINLHLSEVNNGMHRIYDSLFTGTHSVSIPLVRLDNLQGLKNVDFMKIDIEGAEAGAFRGMQQILKESKRMAIVMEFSPASIREAGDNGVEVINLLKSNGFKLMRIRGKSRWLDSLRSRLITIRYDHLLRELPKFNTIVDSIMKELNYNKNSISKDTIEMELIQRLKKSGVRLRLFQNILCLKNC